MEINQYLKCIQPYNLCRKNEEVKIINITDVYVIIERKSNKKIFIPKVLIENYFEEM